MLLTDAKSRLICRVCRPVGDSVCDMMTSQVNNVCDWSRRSSANERCRSCREQLQTWLNGISCKIYIRHHSSSNYFYASKLYVLQLLSSSSSQQCGTKFTSVGNSNRLICIADEHKQLKSLIMCALFFVECYWLCSAETVHYKSDETENFCGFKCAATVRRQ